MSASRQQSPAPWVRIVIVDYNAGAFLQTCVDALAAQTMPEFEAVIVDNGSTDPPISALNLPDGRFRIERPGGNMGFAAGSNFGARGSASPWLAMLNPDTRPWPDWLAELRAATERHPWARVFGSTQLDGTDPRLVDGFGDVLSVYGMAWRNLGGRPATDLPSGDREVFSPCAASALYATSLFDATGGFDESFFCYLEDVDLGFRLRLRGERCLQVRRAVVEHTASSITGRMSAFSVYHSYRNRLWLLAKTVPWPLLGPVLTACSVATAVALGRPRAKPYRGAALRGTWAGLKGLPCAFRARGKVQQQRITSTLETARMLVWTPLRRQRDASLDPTP